MDENVKNETHFHYKLKVEETVLPRNEGLTSLCSAEWETPSLVYMLAHTLPM